ncbi:hypothetical protein DPM19_12625 [Actinomadura craniellae]|uniref:VTC domain-containing protein n=2 Tax=Actinomadura craniellae TaxID=2231787 RepID=A0A365H7E1_9ACTN|nr:hypothetical protein DPM19_12625 [Actinomadura craniellae]
MVWGLPPVGLDEVLAAAELQTRVDRKYLLPAAALPALAAAVAGRYAVLEIGGRRCFEYSSTYFDTPDLLTFRQHRQGRRRRFKIRTRSYLDSGECMFEVKLAGARDRTEKRRMPHDIARRGELTREAHAFLADSLHEAYRMDPPDRIGPSATTGYLRATLVQTAGTGRVTCDVGLSCTAGGRTVRAAAGQVLVETKSPGAEGPMDRALRGLGVRPLSISKYCLAVAALQPGMRANRWQPALRRYFDERTAGHAEWARLR